MNHATVFSRISCLIFIIGVSLCAATELPSECGKAKLFSRAGKISGGTDAKKGQFPWMSYYGYIQHSLIYEIYCGGSLITAKHVLTAAHCVILSGNIAVAFKERGFVRLGQQISRPGFRGSVIGHKKEEDEKDANALDIPIRKTIIHEDYTKKYDTAVNNIALLVLKEEATFSDYIIPLCLPDSTTKYTPGTKLTVIGFGSLGQLLNNQNLTSLQFAEVDLLDTAECKKEYRISDTDHVICAQGKQAESTCNGDGGGPLTVVDENDRSIQLGIIYYGFVETFNDTKYCDGTKPFVNMDVAYFMPWIKEKIAG